MPIVLIVIGVVALLELYCVGGGIALLLPAIEQARQAAQQANQGEFGTGGGGLSGYSEDEILGKSLKSLGLAYYRHIDQVGKPPASWDYLAQSNAHPEVIQRFRDPNVKVCWGRGPAQLQQRSVVLSEYVCR